MSEKTDTAAIPTGQALHPEVPVLSSVDQIRQRRSRITSGAWQWREERGYPQALVAAQGSNYIKILAVVYGECALFQDADFIASAPADIDTLLALLEESEAMNQALEATLKTLEESYRALRGDYDLLSECLEQVQRYRVGVPA